MSQTFKINLALPKHILKGAQTFEEIFTIKLNGNSFVALPRFIAAYFSEEVEKILEIDHEAKEAQFNFCFGDFESEKKAKKVLESYQNPVEVEINEKTDYIEFFKFGCAIGNDDFKAPYLKNCEKRSIEEITADNVVNKIVWKLLAFDGPNLDEEFTFIAKNFSEISKREDFIKWATDESNWDLTEQIIKNNNLHLKTEDDLVEFIIKTENFNLLKNSKTECCSKQILSRLYNIWTSRKYDKTIIEFLNDRLLNENDDLGNEELEKRYDREFVEYIKNNSIKYLKDKIVTLESIISNDLNELKGRISTIEEKQSNSAVFTEEYKNKLDSIERGANSVIVDNDFSSNSSTRALSSAKGRELRSLVIDLEGKIQYIKENYIREKSIKENYIANNGYKKLEKDADLNNITDYGCYTTFGAHVTSSLKNRPNDLPGVSIRLIVGNSGGSGNPVFQEIITYNTGDRWYRVKENASWGSWYRH